MQHHFTLSISRLMAANEAFEGEQRADRYMLSNLLMKRAADNHGHSAPGLPVETGLFLH